MAFIQCTNKTSSTLTVQLEGLDSTWDKGNRTIYWYAVVANTNVEPWEDYYPESSYKTLSTLKSTNGVQCGYTVGGACQLTGLSQNTQYHIKALVYSDIGDYTITSLYGEATTSAGTTSSPHIQSFGVNQVDVGSQMVEWSLFASNIIPGTTQYLIYSRVSGTEEWKLKAKGTFTTTYNGGLSYYAEGAFSLQYGNYEIKAELDANGESAIRSITVTPALNPKITELRPNILVKSALEIEAECSYNSNVVYEFYYTTAEIGTWVLMNTGRVKPSVFVTKCLQEGVTYRFFVRVTFDGWYYEDSSVLTYTARTLERPSNLVVDRGYKSLYFEWNDVPYVSYYSAFLKRDAENVTYLKCIDSSVTFSDETLKDVNTIQYFTTMDFGTTYKFTVRPYYQSYTYYIGDCKVTEFSTEGTNAFGWNITTLPAPPTLSLSSQDGKIYINYGVLASSGVDSFVFELFSDSSYSNASRCESITVANNNSSNLNPSGSTSFNGSYGAGTYYVRARTFFNSLGSITESGADYVYATVTLSSTKPDKWSWDTSNDRLNAYSAIRKVSDFTVKDFSYLVWNDFVDKVNEFLTYKKYDNATINEVKYGFPATTTYAQMLQYAKMNNTDADGKFLTAKRFNIVSYCIGSMKATGLSEQSSGDTVYGHYFITLADVLNSIT